MTAPKRNGSRGILAVLCEHTGVKLELGRLDKAASKHARKTMGSSFFPQGHWFESRLKDLAQVVSDNDWRSPLERAADRLNRAARYIRRTLVLVLDADTGGPTYATIPLRVWQDMPKARIEEQIAGLSRAEVIAACFGFARERQERRTVELSKLGLDLVGKMDAFADSCDREARRLRRILKVRDRRFDRLGPMLDLIRRVTKGTGSVQDAAVARLLTDAFAATGRTREFSAEAIRKMRERYLPTS